MVSENRGGLHVNTTTQLSNIVAVVCCQRRTNVRPIHVSSTVDASIRCVITRASVRNDAPDTTANTVYLRLYTATRSSRDRRHETLCALRIDVQPAYAQFTSQTPIRQKWETRQFRRDDVGGVNLAYNKNIYNIYG